MATSSLLKTRNTFDNGQVDERAMYYDKLSVNNIKKAGGSPVIPTNRNENIYDKYAPKVLGDSTSKDLKNTAQGRGVQSTGIVPRGGSKSSSEDKKRKEQENRRKEAERAYKSMMNQKIGGIDSSYNANRSIIENLMASLNPKYQSTQDEYRRTMDENQQKDVNALAALTAAYGTSDSEQRQQMQERKQNEYAKNFSQFIDSINKQKAEEQATYQNRLLELIAQAEQAKANVRADATIGLQEWNDKFNAASDAAEQQAFDNNVKLQTLAQSGKRIGTSEGFTPQQAQAIQSSYASDLQKMLGQAAYMPSGGREYVAKTLAQKYGDVLDAQSIYDDVMSFAPNGWEGNYKAMYKNPTSDPYAGLSALFQQNQ